MMKHLITAVALATTMAAPADASTDTRSALVSYRDLNLSRPEGVQKLRERVRMAVERVCQGETFSLFELQETFRCRREARERVLPQLAALVAKARMVELARRGD